MTEDTDVEPSLLNRIVWAVFLGAVALALMYQDEVVKGALAASSVGSGNPTPVPGAAGEASVLTGLKVSSLLVAIPLMLCIVIAVLSFLKWLREDKPHLAEGTLKEDE
jgi:choline-glycine betaine transporter